MLSKTAVMVKKPAGGLLRSREKYDRQAKRRTKRQSLVSDDGQAIANFRLDIGAGFRFY